MKNYVIIGLLVVGAFVGGVIIGNIIVPKLASSLSPGQSATSGPARTENVDIKNPGKPSNQISPADESLRSELNNLKSISERVKLDYEQRLDKEILARSEVELELAKLKEGLSDKGGISPTASVKPKKNSPLSQAVRMQIEKRFVNRIKILKEKAGLSAYQESELDRLTAEAVEKTVEASVEMTEKLMAGEEMPEELATRMEEANTQYEQKLKELLTYPQYVVHQEILEAERKEQMAQTVKMYMDGMPGMKGITESLGLSSEQQDKVKTLFEEKLKNAAEKKEKGSVSNGPRMPADDKEFTDKIKAVLTPEQYPAFEEYLKQQEELRKMAEKFMPKVKEEKESK
jgi:hypothetical protein